ncbi:hypothetical protein PS834_02740 [Pseudomonas fluorescens]|nr:hypothetical protein PS834_02740 [Pseudomonas fluorescens]
MHNKSLSYRPDIDGLRAVAVLAVVFFHFNKEWLPGGFVGVDIFFVISGFLITGIVAKQVATGTFSFGDFYIRRVKRILPAAFFVTLCTLIFGLTFMLPEDSKALSISAIATTLSAANIYFWRFLDTGYFAASSDTVPLLHMWSLGVEEQFYLIWPALLLITYKLGGRSLTVATAFLLAAISFWYGEKFLVSDPTFAYYMLPSRGGELLLGGITFFVCDSIKGKVGRIGAEVIGCTGAALIVWSLAFIRETEGFPGFISLVPSLGAALVITSGSVGQTTVARTLSIRPMVAIGLVSFSLYLWHWPVLAFYRYAYGHLDLVGGLICLFLIIFFTLLSYFLVEKTFRNSKKTEKIKLYVAAGTLVGLAALSVSGILLGGVLPLFSPTGYQEKLNKLKDNTGPAFEYPYVCQVGAKKEFLDNPKCVVGSEKNPPKTLLFGDSNAAHYMGFFKIIAENMEFSIRNIEHASCPPFPGTLSIKYVDRGYKESCPAFNKMVRDVLYKYDTIIIGGTWPKYEKTSIDFEPDLRNTIEDFLKDGKKVIIALRAPGFIGYDKACAEKSIKIPFLSCEKRSNYSDHGEIATNERIRKIASEYKNTTTLSLRNLICTNGTCSAYKNGIPLYYDEGHLSIPGSEILGQEALKKGKVQKEIVEAIVNGPIAVTD